MIDILTNSQRGWLKEIPEKWRMMRVKNLFEISKEKNSGEEIPVLSLTQKGIKIRDISNNEGQLAESYENYTRIRKNDIVFNPMDLRTGAVDLSIYDGAISLAYTTIRRKKDFDVILRYYKYFFEWHYLNEIFFPYGQGVSEDHRWTLKDDILMNFPILYPPIETQRKVAEYLDIKTNLINELITKKENLIALLLQKQQSLISVTVCKGLESNIKMKSSGLDWIGDIPEAWSTRRFKYVYRLIKRPINNSDDVITAFRDGRVTLRKNRREDGFTFALKEIGYQGIQKGDLVVHGMDGFAGAIGVSDSDGKATPVYSVCVSINKASSEYYAYLLRTLALNGYISSLSRGIRERSTEFKWNVIGNLDVPLPSYEAQVEIADFLKTETKKINDAIKLIENQIKKIKEYRSSIIYSAVTGKIKI